MRRRQFIALLGAVACLDRAQAQQRMPRVGVLLFGRMVPSKNRNIAVELARLGYVEGRNITGFTSSSPTLAADRFGISTVHIAVSSEAELVSAFERIDSEKVQAVLVEVNPNSTRLSVHIIDQCLVRDLPSVFPWAFTVQAGALMSYGPPSVESIAGAARYVDRILKGAKISELPFEEPTEIKLAINLRTARSMKIAVPQTLLACADEIID